MLRRAPAGRRVVRDLALVMVHPEGLLRRAVDEALRAPDASAGWRGGGPATSREGGLLRRDPRRAAPPIPPSRTARKGSAARQGQTGSRTATRRSPCKPAISMEWLSAERRRLRLASAAAVGRGSLGVTLAIYLHGLGAMHGAVPTDQLRRNLRPCLMRHGYPCRNPRQRQTPPCGRGPCARGLSVLILHRCQCGDGGSVPPHAGCPPLEQQARQCSGRHRGWRDAGDAAPRCDVTTAATAIGAGMWTRPRCFELFGRR